MIYTDLTHIVADSKQELHDWADSQGIGRHWYRGVRKKHPHYDCPKFFLIELLDLIRNNKVKHVSSKVVLYISQQML